MEEKFYPECQCDNLSRAPTERDVAEPNLADLGPEQCDMKQSASALLVERLDADTMAHIASFVQFQGVLAAAATCKQWANVFQRSVTNISISSLSLRGAPVRPALEVRAPVRER